MQSSKKDVKLSKVSSRNSVKFATHIRKYRRKRNQPEPETGEFFQPERSSNGFKTVGIKSSNNRELNSLINQNYLSGESYNLKILERIFDCVKVLDCNGDLIYMSRRGQQALEIDNFSVSRKINWFDLLEYQAAETAKVAIETAKQVGYSDCQFFCRTLKGTPKWWETFIVPISSENNEIEKLIAISRDITAQHIAEDQLCEKEQLISAIVETAPNLIYLYDLIENRNLYTNDKMEKMFGYSSAEVLKMGDQLLPTLVHPDDFAFTSEKMENVKQAKDGEIIRFEYRLRHKNGDWRWIISSESVFLRDADGQPIQKLGFVEDITEQKLADINMGEAQLQIRQAQKMEAIGKLSGGIAHDFNNLLAVIMLQVDMLDLQLAPDSPLRYRVGEIKSASARAASLTRQLLAFSRKQMLQPRAVNFNKTVKEMGSILHRLIGEDIELVMELESDLGLVLVDPDQVSQVLMNLAVNARDAMPDGGKLLIKTTNLSLTEKTRNKLASQPAGKYVQLMVTDTGCGMDSATQERIFEPFFTTKGAGKGTGLGLSTVYGIVKQSGGFIWVSSAPNRGTTFRIDMPCAHEADGSEKPEELHPEILLGKETILLVEDEELIRRAAFEVLRALGYHVLAAKDGVEALEIARGYERPIDLVLTDVIMPKMNGRDLIDRLRNIKSNFAVLFMSGYTDDIIARHGVLEEKTMFLEKPFAPTILATKVREAIEHRKIERK